MSEKIKQNASPQVEDGHIRIAYKISEAIMKTNFSAYQTRVLWVIWRKTYGWRKKEDHISVSQFVCMTGINQGHVSRTLNELKKRNIINREGRKISFNKNYLQWIDLPKGERDNKEYTNSGI